MEKQILNYRVIIKPDQYLGSKKPCFTILCPTLEVVDYGNTIEEALSNIKEGLELRLETLQSEGREIPVDDVTQEIITTTQVQLPSSKNQSFALA